MTAQFNTSLASRPFAVITPSYRNDYELAADLCRSIDKYMRGDFKHYLLTPKRDLPLFRQLAGPRREVLAEDDILGPRGFVRLPIPTKVHIPGLTSFRIREQWFSRKAGRVNGWMLQQILKLSATDFTDCELLVFVDSDVELLRDFDSADLWRNDCVRLNEHSKAADQPGHQAWVHAARNLLGLPAPEANALSTYRNYIGNLIAWRRSNLVRLQDHITNVQDTDWATAFARGKSLSEYILYGVFCREKLKKSSGHLFEELDVCCSLWLEREDLSTAAIQKLLSPHHAAIHIQSTISMPIEQRRHLIREVRREAQFAIESQAAGARPI